MRGCIEAVRSRLPSAILESRKDSAFFSDKTVDFLDSQGVQFSISVPFERFAELKSTDRVSTAVEASGLPVGLLRERLGTQVLGASLPIPVSTPSGEKAKQGACAVGIVHPT